MTQREHGWRGAVKARSRAPLGMCRFLHTGSGYRVRRVRTESRTEYTVAKPKEQASNRAQKVPKKPKKLQRSQRSKKHQKSPDSGPLRPLTIPHCTYSIYSIEQGVKRKNAQKVPKYRDHQEVVVWQNQPELDNLQMIYTVKKILRGWCREA